MSKHTPEPWRVHFYNENVGYGIAAGPDIPTQWPDKMVVEFGGTQDGDSQGVISKENAERVVACVNACKGLADPSVVPDAIAALKLFRDAADQAIRNGGDHRDNGECMRACRAVLTKAGV